VTLPFEEKRAINYTRQFLFDLMIPSKTPRIPKEIRDRARSLLRHYPQEYRVDEIMSEEEFGFFVN
jgi:hypothetical protein